MKRDILNSLLKWKEQIIRGARQVGKTTVIRQLGKHFDSFIEVNFEELPDIASFFEHSLSPDDIINNLQNYLDIKITDGSTLLFFDEIQECPNAITSLRYFFEKRQNLHVAAAGSLIDFELENISFPVGRIDFYYLYPLSFGEFLEANGKESLRHSIKSTINLPDGIHKQLLTKLRDYTIVGGMPQVVNEYINNGDLNECQHIQTSVIETFLSDFPKYASKNQIKYLSTIFNAAPGQLGRKIKYSNISNLYKSRELSQALELLELAGLVTRIYHSSSNGIPLEHEKDFKKFKLLFFDVGMAMRILRIPIQEVLTNEDITLINEGAIAEQVAGQELLAYSSCREKGRLYYWHREAKSSNAEVDYIISKGKEIIPVEVKSGLKRTMKSLHVFMEEKNPPYALCFSQEQMYEKDMIKYIPLYQIESIFQ
ncbi:MAG: ATP-binding protein [Planctomycetota bacterium]|jgi:predicted AAA+ superfamily ATPase